MQYKVTREEFTKLDESVQALYKQDGEEFVLSVEGMPEIEDVSGLKAKVEELLAEKKDAKASADAATRAAAEAKAAKELAEANKTGDIDAINASWAEKYGKLEDVVTSLNGTIAKITSGAAATKMASELALTGQSEVLMPHIERRLATEMVDGVPRVVVKGVDGKPSALTVEELQTEFKNNEAFASVIVGSKARGKGTHNQNPGAGGAGKVIPRSQFEEMSPGDQMAYTKEGGTLTDEAA